MENPMEQDFLKQMGQQPSLTPDLLVHKIYTLLEKNILGMKLPPETSLAEENIAGLIGVSRSPVREALSQLEDDGLVRKAAKSHTDRFDHDLVGPPWMQRSSTSTRSVKAL
jgi:DNA-binding GntR family transcriptional regulator